MTDTTVSVSSGRVNFTPYATAKMSDGLFKASENYTEGILSINFFLYSASIELGLKSAILSKDNSDLKKKHIQSKIGHDLEKAYSEFQIDFPNEQLLDQNDLLAIAKINPFFKSKGLEYFTADVITEYANGLSSFPEMAELRKVAFAINQFLVKSSFFQNC